MTKPTIDDAKHMWQLVKTLSPALDLNSAYKYLIICEAFPNCCVVAKRGGKLIGFITGFITHKKPDTLFVWQIGIDFSERGKGLASQLLLHLVEQQERTIKYIEATITPSNEASKKLFQRLAATLNTSLETRLLFKKEHFPSREEHEEEYLYRIGPIR